MMREQRRRDSKDKRDATYNIGWVPKTRLGQLVYEGKITTMSEALASRYPLKEPQIVDILLPEMEDEVLDVNMVQRMTDSGRRVRFAITAVVGNQDGFVGMGRAKGKEVGPTIRNAIDRAKLNLIEIKRGCGSWECGCGNPHTFPFEVEGKCGSVKVRLKPAPRGVGLALGDVAKKVIGMAGIQDAWGLTKGHTKTTVNYSFAAFEALKETARIKVSDTQAKNLHIMTGPVSTVYLETSPEEMKRIIEDKKRREEEKIKELAKKVGDDKDEDVLPDGDAQDTKKPERPPRGDRRPDRDRYKKGHDKRAEDNKPPEPKKEVKAEPKKEGKAPEPKPEPTKEKPAGEPKAEKEPEKKEETKPDKPVESKEEEKPEPKDAKKGGDE